MGLVLQRQRRAVESAFSNMHFVIHKETKFYLYSKRVSLLGISVGVGTCSDLHGIYIAVLGEFSPKNHSEDIKFPIHCSGLTLLRELTPEELVIEKGSRWFNDQPLLLIEGLLPRETYDPSSKRVDLVLNGKKISYVVL